MKKIISLLLLLLVSVSFSFAHTDHSEHGDFEQAEAIVNAQIPCSDLTDDQLEIVGDYLMEQMHPGERHSIMDDMMGGEGSESLRGMHIQLARSIYCTGNADTVVSKDKDDVTDMVSGGMMSSKGAEPGMMGGAMMGMMEGSSASGYQMSTMGLFGMGVAWLVYMALLAFIFAVIFWWTYNFMVAKKSNKKSNKKKQE